MPLRKLFLLALALYGTGAYADGKIVGKAAAGSGRICVDPTTLSDARKAPEIMADTPYSETYRPQFHFSSKTNWLNDPNGLVFFNGEYHLFFQHNPAGINWGNMTWGHAVSRDLVHWSQLANALEPDKLGTMFSGSAVIDWHNSTGFGAAAKPPLVAIYTAAGNTSPESKGAPFSQCIAFSLDHGRTFTKFTGNPVLPHIVAENRDPKLVWFEPTHEWTLALYLDGEDFALFTSTDLKHWTQIQKVHMPGCGECPDFFPINVHGEKTTKWVLTAANGHYLVGDYDGKKFHAEGTPRVADSGANYYAVQTYSDIPASDGRRIQIAWMNGGSYPGMPFNQQMSFPCELTLHRTPFGLVLRRNPVHEIGSLYKSTFTARGVELAPQQDGLKGANPRGDLFDIALEFKPEQASAVTIKVRGETITLDLNAGTISFLSRSTPIQPIDGKIKLRLLIDRSSIELFGNDGQVSMSSCFVPPPENHELSLFVEGATITLGSVVVHELNSAWN